MRTPSNAPLGRDLGQRQQHEGAFQRARMRQGQLGRGPSSRRHRRSDRCPACAGPSAARARGRGRTARSTAWARSSSAGGGRSGRRDDRAIDERRLVGDAPRRRAVVGRARQEPDVGAVAKRGDGAVQRVADLSSPPTLPPSAISASAMTLAEDRDADVVEGGGDRGVRLVDGDADGGDLLETVEHRFGDGAGGGLHQPITLGRRTPRLATSTTWS